MFNMKPKEQIFFELLRKLAERADEGARHLVELVGDPTDMDNKIAQIKNIEHAGDEVKDALVERLNRTFITPLDREDIHALGARIDDILNRIDKAAHRMRLYKARPGGEDVRELAAIIAKSTALIVTAVGDLGHPKQRESILQTCRDVDALESEGDRVSQHALASLFEGTPDPVEIIKWKDILQDLEKATDKCAGVADILRAIVLKNG